MSYTTDYDIKKIMQSLYGLGKQISSHVYTGNRPQAITEQVSDFVIVSISNRLSSTTYGGGYGVVPSMCNIEIFVKLKKSGAENIDKLNTMLNSLLSNFPYSDSTLQLARPTVMLRGNDGLGFSAVLVRAELLVK